MEKMLEMSLLSEQTGKYNYPKRKKVLHQRKHDYFKDEAVDSGFAWMLDDGSAGPAGELSSGLE